MSQPIESISTPAQRYSAALDSVNLISARIAAPQGNQMEEQRRKDIDRNVEHLRYRDWETDRKSTRLNSSHSAKSRMPSSA